MTHRLKSVFTCLTLLLVVVAPVSADRYPKNPQIDILNYRFQLELSDQTDEVKCVETVDVRFLGDGITALRLDLVKAVPELSGKGMRVSGASLGGQALSFTHEKDVLTIKLTSPSRAGQRLQIQIAYSGIPASGLKIANNKYGERTFFSDNWPDQGRHWLAVVDHPYDKATCEFMVTAPAHYQVVSNGLRVEESDRPQGMRMTHWKQSVPIASWLYVLGVARFAVQHVDDFDHKAIETWVYHQDREAGFYDFAIPTKSALEFYSDAVGPFVYEKLANIQSNSVSGGMEAASAILYSQKSVVGDRNERWRNVVIHEIAHQWFGNSVTEYDWDDVWLSEGFATYFTLLYIEHAYGREAFLNGLMASKKNVMDFAAKNPGYRIIHDNLGDMSKVTSSHTYQKGSWILHMLRGVIGTDAFWKGIRVYYAEFMNRNATTSDFRRVMEEASGMDLKGFFDQWLYKPGDLKVSGEWRYDRARKEATVTLRQVQQDGRVFNMPIEVLVTGKDGKTLHRQTVQLADKPVTATLPLTEEPERLVLDPDSWVLMEATVTKK